MKVQRETVHLLVPVTIRYTNRSSRAHAIATIKRELGMEYSTVGQGFAHAKTGRPRQLKPVQVMAAQYVVEESE